MVRWEKLGGKVGGVDRVIRWVELESNMDLDGTSALYKSSVDIM